ncbi:hypothetical protein K9M79_03610 [Candidatus Woesearchaeota archaeon]|nr:hypothetical protein [Candidatus Woesearchaeota archaeon]
MTEKQKKAAKKNIKKAQQKWKSLSSRAKARRQPEGRARAKPGTKGQGDYYRVVVRSKNEFTSFRNHDVGDKGHIQRLAGRRKSGNWDTQAWLIQKDDAKVIDGTLVSKTKDVKDLLSNLRTKPIQVKGDIFEAKSRKNVPEKDKPTPAQQRARRENIKKAQKARWK